MRREWSETERRHFQRLERTFAFHYGTFDDLLDIRLEEEGVVLDIGAGGVRFLARRSWQKNEQLLMQLDFSSMRTVDTEADPEGDESRMLVVGTVMWSSDVPADDRFEVGVRFSGRVRRQR